MLRLFDRTTKPPRHGRVPTPRPAILELTESSPLPLLVPGQRVAYRCSAVVAHSLIAHAARRGTLVLATESSREPGVWLFAGARHE